MLITSKCALFDASWHQRCCLSDVIRNGARICRKKNPLPRRQKRRKSLIGLQVVIDFTQLFLLYADLLSARRVTFYGRDAGSCVKFAQHPTYEEEGVTSYKRGAVGWN